MGHRMPDYPCHRFDFAARRNLVNLRVGFATSRCAWRSVRPLQARPGKKTTQVCATCARNGLAVSCLGHRHVIDTQASNWSVRGGMPSFHRAHGNLQLLQSRNTTARNLSHHRWWGQKETGATLASGRKAAKRYDAVAGDRAARPVLGRVAMFIVVSFAFEGRRARLLAGRAARRPTACAACCWTATRIPFTCWNPVSGSRSKSSA
jgi:hypothetical protein